MLTVLSNMVMPLVVIGIILTGMIKKVDVYDCFVKGAVDGLKIVVKIMPTLIGLMVAVGVLRASGFLSLIGTLFGESLERWGLGSEVVPLVFIKMFSSSAATGLVLDIPGIWSGFKNRYVYVHYDELHRDLLLYHECILYGVQSEKNQMDSAGSASGNSSRYYRQFFHCFISVKFYTNKK